MGPITIFDARSFPTRIAGEVKHFDFTRWEKTNGASPMGRNSFFAIAACDEAMKDAGLKPGSVNPERLGVYFGAGDSGFNFEEYASVIANSVQDEPLGVDTKKYFENSALKVKPQLILEQEPVQVVNHLAKIHNAQGIVSNCLTACAASSQAIGEGTEIIRRGQAEVMITGGTHSMIHPLGVAGFILLTTLSTRNDDPEAASRPFDKSRDGFVLSEGSGVLILEELEHAKRRGARVYAEIAGYGVNADAYRLTDPHPEGRGAIAAMHLALQDARALPQAVSYINAHGTSTKLNDQIETRAVKEVFGDHARKLPVTSNKSMLGHLIAAAGAVELIASILSIRDGVIPPTINYQTPDETCDLDYVPNRARSQKVDVVLSNSFGFGGQNSVLVVRRYNGS